MPESLLHLLPSLIVEGRAQARAALDAARRAGIDRPDAHGAARDRGVTISADDADSPGDGGDGRPTQARARDRGLLIHGDNLVALADLVAAAERPGGEAQRPSLVYLDPPFDSKADYRSRIVTRTADGREHALQHRAYGDRWAGGTADYLRMLIPRLVLATDLLAADGAIIVHVDWHASHLVRLVLDELLGRDAFVNHLVWSYRSGGASRTTSVPRKHDDLLLYRRGNGFHIRPLFERQYLDKSFIGSKQDAAGRPYVDTILRDVIEGTLRLVDEGEVREVSVRPVLNVSGERTGYATQKPEGLLELLLRWTTNPGDLVVDPFAGSGTTAVAAHRLGRRWVAIDANAHGIAVTRARLDRLGADYRSGSKDAAADGRIEPATTSAAIDLCVERGGEREPGGVDPTLDRSIRIHLDRLVPAPGLDELLLGASADVLADPLATVAGWSVEFLDGRRRTEWRTPAGTLATTISSASGPPASEPVAVEVIDLAGRTARRLLDPRYDRGTQPSGRVERE